MDQEFFDILQVSADATDEEIKASYEALKKKYSEEQWQDGEAGNNAARMLGKLDTAYEEIMTERKEQRRETGGSGAFDEIAECIKSGDIAAAQKKLDDCNERNAEWHYLQSVVFYEKNWMNESKKQLEIAMKMDPSSGKYRDAYDKLNARTEYQKQAAGAPNTNPDLNTGNDQMGGAANCFEMCYTCLCVNCLFNLCCNCQ